ncbi:TusE/DsrC/DsvC family sulfur relay protein [Salmonella enterica subsp. enterica serovar Anatum]|nr:TusE/DsrC/DsvC family sulfur relay protein [Salmonella enterica subsp. enterica serovar Anatum]
MAANEGIELSAEHWEVVRFVREFYLEFNTSPAIRMLVKAMARTSGLKRAMTTTCQSGQCCRSASCFRPE